MRDFFRGGRSPAFAREAMIATSHPLSTAAGVEILAAGGNAMDAALAAVAVQCVVDPLMTGIGGDCFALYAPAGGEVVALNGSGRAPAAATVERLTGLGLEGAIPQTSPHAVTIPGAVSAWAALHARFASLPMDRLFARAVGYAEKGFPITPRVAWDWERNAELVGKDEGGRTLFLPLGRAPKTGETHANPNLGRTLRAIAAKGAEAFYCGDVAQSLVARLNALGGLHTAEDFADGMTAAAFVAPISAPYRGYEVVECPPNGQGVAALMILRILEGFDLSEKLSDAERIHLHAEATKLAYYHRDALIGDPETLGGTVETLLSEPAIAALRRRVDPERALPPALWDEPEHKDTVYLCAVDRDGNAVSFINSIFHGFGSTRADPETGVVLH
ncbi:MAG: gamma-glutamyltransferase family protein, partial [Rhodospirillaceae bacterium]